ncbi:heavy metal-associated isoprenylated plant protein 39-like [Senna tora]|uniref:Heavy metal-associated isoprenylated plant protein 39-like n=1 Tax=Senna tora TaxID=362788 RepID=A0A834WDF9_9FABA|nr:heavy metal-associated isoprenylated plant protein 39-like [Senna tora]
MLDQNLHHENDYVSSFNLDSGGQTFKWRPYVKSFPKFYNKDYLKSFAYCLRNSELDIPGQVDFCDKDEIIVDPYKAAWTNYSMPVTDTMLLDVVVASSSISVPSFTLKSDEIVNVVGGGRLKREKVDMVISKLQTLIGKLEGDIVELKGVESVSVDMKEKKMTISGDIDPVCVVEKLRKICPTDVVSVGPAKEADQKKKEETNKKENNNNNNNNKAKEQEIKKDEPNWGDFIRASEIYHHQQMTRPYPYPYYCTSVVEEDPNSCVIF